MIIYVKWKDISLDYEVLVELVLDYVLWNLANNLLECYVAFKGLVETLFKEWFADNKTT